MTQETTPPALWPSRKSGSPGCLARAVSTRVSTLFAAAWAAGLRLPREAAVAEALALPLEEHTLPWA